MLPSLKKDNVSIYYVSRTSNTDGVDSLLDKVDEMSTEAIPESWRSEVTLTTPALYIYTSGTTGKNKGFSKKWTYPEGVKCWVRFSNVLSLGKTYQISNTLEDLALCLWELLCDPIWVSPSYTYIHTAPPRWYVEQRKKLTKKYKNSYENGGNLALNRFWEFFK